MDEPAPPTPVVGRWVRARRLAVLAVLVLALLGTLGYSYGPRLRCVLDDGKSGCPGAVDAAAPEGEDASLSAPGAAFLLRRNTGVELDADPPAEVTGAQLAEGDLFYDARRPPAAALYTADHPIAQWRGDGVPDAGSCLDAIVTNGGFGVAPEAGQVLCVQTTEGRIAALSVRQVLDDGVSLVGTVWN